jgi:enoyl-CoA hydratase
MMQHENAGLSLEEEGGVVILRFARPEVHNVIDADTHRALAETLRSISSRRDVRCLLIGSEGKSFCAGGNPQLMERAHQSKEYRDALVDEGRLIYECLTGLSFPIVTAVQGAAIGLGATIVACSDIIVAWRGAKIADPHVRIGLVAGDGGVTGWSQSIGMNRAKRYLLTGDRLDAQSAFQMGLVTDLVETPEDALPVAREIALRIAALPRDGVIGTKQAFAQLSKQYAGAVFHFGCALEAETLAGPDLVDCLARLNFAANSK